MPFTCVLAVILQKDFSITIAINGVYYFKEDSHAMTKVARINALPYMLVKLHRITTVHHIHVMVPRTFSNSFVPTPPSGEVEG